MDIKTFVQVKKSLKGVYRQEFPANQDRTAARIVLTDDLTMQRLAGFDRAHVHRLVARLRRVHKIRLSLVETRPYRPKGCPPSILLPLDNTDVFASAFEGPLSGGQPDNLSRRSKHVDALVPVPLERSVSDQERIARARNTLLIAENDI